jgi:YhcH/YjgK/YiaL family protein
MISGYYRDLILLSGRIHKNLERALVWLAEDNWKTMANGVFEIQRKDIVVTIKDSVTKLPNERVWESHRSHADIQFLIEGTELIHVAALNDGFHSTEAYNLERDIERWDGNPAFTGTLILSHPTAAILLPQDMHKPDMLLDKPVKVRKIVIKVALI